MSECRRALAAALACALLLGLAQVASAGPWTRQSFYVEMRDGVPIAVDLYLPAAVRKGVRVPAIVRMTRYWRAPRFRLAWRPFLDQPQELPQRFLAQGYAWVDVDVRGSGASGGVQRSLWSDDAPEHDWAKFAVPTVVNGRVYLATFSGQVLVYGLRETSQPTN